MERRVDILYIGRKFGEWKILGLELVQLTIELFRLIKKRMKTSQNRQKKWVDLRMRKLEFNTWDYLNYKFSPTREVMRFGEKGKLNSLRLNCLRFWEVEVGRLAYAVALPLQLVGIQNVIHVYMLCKYITGPHCVAKCKFLRVREDLSYKEILHCIIDENEQVSTKQEISFVKG